MDKLKFVLIGLGLVFSAILLYFAVALAMSLFWYLIVFGVIAIGGYGAYKFLHNQKKSPPQLEPGNPEQELLKAQQIIDDYRRKLTSGKE